MRSLTHLLVAAMAILGCDSGIYVTGSVTELDGGPVPRAKVFVADRLGNRGLDAYLRGDTTAQMGLGWSTDDAGEFSADRVLGGSGKHEVWVVVKKSGYMDHAEHVWTGKGSPDRDFAVSVTLVRVDDEPSEETGAAGQAGQAND